MSPLLEKLRQKCCGFTSSFEATSNERNAKTLAETEKHARTIMKMQKHVRDLEKAMDAMLKEAEAAYVSPGPRQYDLAQPGQASPGGERPDTLITVKTSKAVPVPVDDPAAQTRHAGLNEIGGIRELMESKIKLDVHGPADKWLADLDVAKVHFRELEELRFALDEQRRNAGALELKKVKQERNKGKASDNMLMRLDQQGQQLDVAKTRFRDKEVAVFEELTALVERADLLRECITQAFAIGGDTLTRAASAAPPPASRSTSLNSPLSGGGKAAGFAASPPTTPQSSLAPAVPEAPAAGKVDKRPTTPAAGKGDKRPTTPDTAPPLPTPPTPAY